MHHLLVSYLFFVFLGLNAKSIVSYFINLLKKKKRSAIWIELRESQKYTRRIYQDMILLLKFSGKGNINLLRKNLVLNK